MTYGYRRMWFLSRKAGFNYCKETIRSLMTKMGLKVTLYHRHQGRFNSYKRHYGRTAYNLLKQKFTAKSPFEVLHTDVTQVKTKNGWCYISVILDQASKEIVAHDVSQHPNLQLVLNTLDRVKMKLNYPGTILHSDQGFMYQHKMYQEALSNLGIIQSMSRKGNCLDNAPIESFFSLLKRECLNRVTLNSVEHVREILHDYLNWYNKQRISLNKKGMTPVEYRINYQHHALI